MTAAATSGFLPRGAGARLAEVVVVVSGEGALGSSGIASLFCKSSTGIDTCRSRRSSRALDVDGCTTALLALVRCAFGDDGVGARVAAGCTRGPKTPEQAFQRLERAIAAGDAAAFYGLRRSADALVDRVGVEGSAAAAHHHPAPSIRRPRRKRRWRTLRAAEEADRGAVLQAHQRRAARRRSATASGSARCRGRSRARSTAPDAMWVARAGRHAVPLRQEQRRQLGLQRARGDWELEKDRAQPRGQDRAATTPSSIRRRRQVQHERAQRSRSFPATASASR